MGNGSILFWDHDMAEKRDCSTRQKGPLEFANVERSAWLVKSPFGNWVSLYHGEIDPYNVINTSQETTPYVDAILLMQNVP